MNPPTSKPPLPTIHTTLSSHLHSYSIFPPRPPHTLPLFHLVKLLSTPVSRPLSPLPTSANLSTILLSSAIQDVLPPNLAHTLLKHLSPHHQHPINPHHTQPPLPPTNLLASEHSLLRSGINLQHHHPQQRPISSKSPRLRHLSISHPAVHACPHPPSLLALLWTHAPSIFPLIFPHIHLFLSRKPGDRNLFAFITNVQHATVTISHRPYTLAKQQQQYPPNNSINKNSKSTSAPNTLHHPPHYALTPAAEPVRDSNHPGDNHDPHLDVAQSLTGVCGVHLIVFPIEVLDCLKWRVYKPIQLDDIDHRNGHINVQVLRFAQAQKWHRKLENHLYPDFTQPSVNQHQQPHQQQLGQKLDNAAYQMGTFLPFEMCSAEVSEAGSSTTEHVPPEDSSHQNCNFLSSVLEEQKCPEDIEKDDHDAFVDIDMGSNLNEFAMLQVNLARFFSSMGQHQNIEHSLSLLRSALQKCCLESATEAMMEISANYEKGIGVKKNESEADKLRLCTQFWEEERKCAVGLDVLRKDKRFCEAMEPERRILQLVKEFGLHRELKRGRGGCSVRDEMPVAELWERINRMRPVLNDTASRIERLKEWVVAQNPLADMGVMGVGEDGDEEPAPIDALYQRQSRIDELLEIHTEDGQDDEEEEEEVGETDEGGER